MNADLSNTDLSGANLSNADLSGANLSNADLSKAHLRNAELKYANLEKAFLHEADLSNAVFNNADLSYADLSNASLQEASLIGTNLSGAILTGACIQNWNIDHETLLIDTQCKYIYLERNYHNNRWILSERFPRNSNITLKPGEFEALVSRQKDTIDLIFIEGIDWQAFLTMFQELKSRYYEDEVSIQAIERKEDNFVVRLETLSSQNRHAEIELSAKDLYEENKRLILQNENLLRVVKTMAYTQKTLAEKMKKPTSQTFINAEKIGIINSGSGNIYSHDQLD